MVERRELKEKTSDNPLVPVRKLTRIAFRVQPSGSPKRHGRGPRPGLREATWGVGRQRGGGKATRFGRHAFDGPPSSVRVSLQPLAAVDDLGLARQDDLAVPLAPLDG